jgi:hypothetical protein
VQARNFGEERTIAAVHNSSLVQWRGLVLFWTVSFQIKVLFIFAKCSPDNPPLHQAAKRYSPPLDVTQQKNDGLNLKDIKGMPSYRSSTNICEIFLILVFL